MKLRPPRQDRVRGARGDGPVPGGARHVAGPAPRSEAEDLPLRSRPRAPRSLPGTANRSAAAVGEAGARRAGGVSEAHREGIMPRGAQRAATRSVTTPGGPVDALMTADRFFPATLLGG